MTTIGVRKWKRELTVDVDGLAGEEVDVRDAVALFQRLQKVDELVTDIVKLFLLYIIDSAASSVTRLGDLLDFGQLYKAFGNNYFV